MHDSDGGTDVRAFTAAAVQVAPVAAPLTADTIAANLEHCVDMVRQCVEATGAELTGDVLHRSGHGARQLGDEIPELLLGAAGCEAGRRGLGEHDELCPGGPDTRARYVDARVDVGADRVGRQLLGDGGHLHGGGGEGTHRQPLPIAQPTTTPTIATTPPVTTPRA